MIDKNDKLTYCGLGQNGRLGNQLFQIASTAGLAKKYGCKFQFPYWHYAPFFKDFPPQEINPIPTSHVYHEVGFHYSDIADSDVVEVVPYSPKSIDLRGYFQSEKYWDCDPKFAQNLFEFSQLLQESAIEKLSTLFANGIPHGPAVSIHFRFGDYVNNPYYADLLNSGYYVRALKLIHEKYPKGAIVLVFTDEKERAIYAMNRVCTEAGLPDTTFFTVGGTDEAEDLFLMSECDANVCANSSFSWWGAYLNQNEKKTVIMPMEWFNGSGLRNNTKDLYPAGVIRI